MSVHVLHAVDCLWPFAGVDRLQGMVGIFRSRRVYLAHHHPLLEHIIHVLSLLMLSVFLLVQLDKVCILLLQSLVVDTER